MERIIKSTQYAHSNFNQCKSLHCYQSLKDTQQFAIKVAEKNTLAILDRLKK